MVFSNISKIKNYKKTFIAGLFIGGGIILLATLRNILILGSYTISQIYFPSQMSASLIRIGPMIQRVEMAVILMLLVCVFIKVCICSLAVCNGISKVFEFNNYKFISTPIALLMLTFSIFIYKSTMEASFWTTNIWPYFSFPFEVIIPLIVYILAEYKSWRSSSSTTLVHK
jgi:spore germination protein KB